MAMEGSRHLWTTAIVASATLAIVGAEIAALRGSHYVFKPLTTLLILAMAQRLPRTGSADYRRLVVVGLLLSTLGDVFLMLPFDGFVFGLGSFLLAHIAYLAALRKRGGWWRARWSLIVYAVIASLVFAQLWPGLPRELKVPVIVYVIALAGMAAQRMVGTSGARDARRRAWWRVLCGLRCAAGAGSLQCTDPHGKSVGAGDLLGRTVVYCAFGWR